MADRKTREQSSGNAARKGQESGFSIQDYRKLLSLADEAAKAAKPQRHQSLDPRHHEQVMNFRFDF